ncbi:MAG: hypothetical protein EBS97_01925 [Verrucomicrobia bacterium]|nr:hypothetical protein [Verrucomicrobiota bacterium]
MPAEKQKKKQSVAEITDRDPFGAAMTKCIHAYPIRKVLEIGAFDGDGSTQVLAKSLSSKGGVAKMVSLEANPERFRNLLSFCPTRPTILFGLGILHGAGLR